MIALRLFDLDTGGGWTVSAGLPHYLALFGRDTLTAAWQAALIGPEMMRRGTLARVAELEARGTHNWRDCQPGKFIYQDTGPLAMLHVQSTRPLLRRFDGAELLPGGAL